MKEGEREMKEREEGRGKRETTLEVPVYSPTPQKPMFLS
jgi:hypothetical protein